tara:strand:- start:204 stop:857 length:654 start_codon:yes stop_codon:yes gene_type:complete
MEKIAENLEKIENSITKLEIKHKVEIIAVSKGFTQEIVKNAINIGITSFGENKVQECELKFKELVKIHQNISIHLIGPLQTNKVKKSLNLFDTIHTLDREKLSLEIKKNISSESKTKNFFIQVNIGNEIQKSGIETQRLREFVKWNIFDLGLNVIGLMCIPPEKKDSTKYFQELYKMGQENNLRYFSMGMSNDYEKAIICGSTHVRIGSSLFGLRKY